jgi:hypothetical protein
MVIMATVALLMLFPFLRNRLSGTDGPYCIKEMKVACPEDQSRTLNVFGKELQVSGDIRVWYPDDTVSGDMEVMVMFPSSQIQYRNFCRMAGEMASHGCVVAVGKEKIGLFWLDLIPGISQENRSPDRITGQDILSAVNWLTEMNSKQGELTGRISLKQVTLVTRNGFEQVQEPSFISDPDNGRKEGIFLVTASIFPDSAPIITRGEFIPFEATSKEIRKEMKPKGYVKEWLSMMLGQLEQTEFFPVRLVRSICNGTEEMNFNKYLNIKWKLVVYFTKENGSRSLR